MHGFSSLDGDVLILKVCFLFSLALNYFKF